MPQIGYIDVEVWDMENEDWAQGKFLVHGYDDVLWTDDADEAAKYVKESIIQKEKSCRKEQNT